MKNFIKKIGMIAVAVIAITSISYAATVLTVPQGGSGASSHQANGIIYSGTAINSPYVSDTQFTRSSSTKETQILKTLDTNIIGGFTIGSDETNIVVSNTSTNETAGHFATNDAGTISADFGWSDGSGDRREQFIASTGGSVIQSNNTIANTASFFQMLSSTNNKLLWDFDTTDDIIDSFEQSQDIAGLGLAGTAITHTDSVTGQSGGLLIGNLAGVGGGTFGAILSSSNGSTTNTAVNLDYNVGAVLNFSNNSNVTTQILELSAGESKMGTEGTNLNTMFSSTPTFNSIDFDPDTTDTINDQFMQSETALGFINGTTISHSDSNADMVSFLAVGGQDGGNDFTSTLSTFDSSNDDRASFQTEFDTGSSAMRAYANATNGNASASIFLKDDAVLITYAPDLVKTAGFVMENTKINLAFSDGTDETHAQLDQNSFDVTDGLGTMKFTVNSVSNVMTSFGGIKIHRIAVSDANYVQLLDDNLISYTSLSAPRTVTILDASTVGDGHTVTVKDAICGANANNITLDPAGTDTIDHQATLTMNVNCQSVSLVSDGGTNWEVTP